MDFSDRQVAKPGSMYFDDAGNLSRAQSSAAGDDKKFIPGGCERKLYERIGVTSVPAMGLNLDFSLALYGATLPFYCYLCFFFMLHRS